jgi:hypothetical protein
MLTVEGNRKQLKEFKVTVRERTDDGDVLPLSLSKLHPLPKELEGTQSPTEKTNDELIKKYGSDNWYDWYIKNWGTKWDVGISSSIVSQSADQIKYHFNSAWSPPIAWLEFVSVLYPKLEFILDYEEGGMAFAGTASVINGEVNIEDREYVPQEDEEYDEEPIPF